MVGREGKLADRGLLWVLRRTGSALLEDFFRLLGANVLWLAGVALVVLLAGVHPAAWALVVVMVPLTAGLGRLAAHGARDEVARLRHFRTGMVARWPAALALGIVQIALMAAGWWALVVGLAGGTFAVIMLGVAGGWLVLLVAGSCAAIWPLLLDPERDDLPTGRLIRLALGLVALRPGRVAVIVGFGLAFVVLGVRVQILGFVLPTIGVLLATYGILPLADRLEGREFGVPDG